MTDSAEEVISNVTSRLAFDGDTGEFLGPVVEFHLGEDDMVQMTPMQADQLAQGLSAAAYKIDVSAAMYSAMREVLDPDVIALIMEKFIGKIGESPAAKRLHVATEMP